MYVHLFVYFVCVCVCARVCVFVCIFVCACIYILVHCFCLSIVLLAIFVHFIQHQQQVAAAVERAKQVTMSELNAIVSVYAYTINCS